MQEYSIRSWKKKISDVHGTEGVSYKKTAAPGSGGGHHITFARKGGETVGAFMHRETRGAIFPVKEEVAKPTGDLKKACWKGYTAVGMKMKNGRKVPNCVPVSEEECPVRRHYKELKKLPIKDLRDRIKQSSRVIDVSGFDKESAISHILRRQHGDKRVDQAFGLKEERENYGLPAHSIKHVMQKIKDGHWEVSSGEVKSGKHLSIIDHTKGKKQRMIHVKEEADHITEDAKRDRVSADLHKQGIGSHWRNPQVLVVHDKHKKKVQQYMDKVTGGWVHVAGHSEESINEETGDVQHLIGITVSHPELKSAEPILKKARVRASSEEEAIKKVKSHYRKAGYKVHDAFHHSTLTFKRKVDEARSDDPDYDKSQARFKKGLPPSKKKPPYKEDSYWAKRKKQGTMEEAATSDNTGYGKGYHGNIGGDDKKYSSMHTKVKGLVGAAGHLSDVKKPNMMVKHFLDSTHGRHIADQPSDSNITSRFKKFKKTYNPEMHEEVEQMHEKGDFWHPNPKLDSKMGGRSAAIVQQKTPIVQQKTPSKQKDDDHLALLKRLAAAGKKIAAEEVEQIDETASVSVTVQATAPANKKYAVTEIHPRKSPRGRTRWKDVSYHSSEEEAKAAADAHAKKNNLHRMKSIVAEELEQIDELKKSTLISYVGKSRADLKKTISKNRALAQTRSTDEVIRGSKQAAKRGMGIDRAYDRLNKEEVEQIDEARKHHFVVGKYEKGGVTYHLWTDVEHDASHHHLTKLVNGKNVRVKNYAGYSMPKAHADLIRRGFGLNLLKTKEAERVGTSDGPLSRLGFGEELEQISEGPQRDATRAKNKLKHAIAGANYKRTGAPVSDPEPQHKTAQAHNKAIGRAALRMNEKHLTPAERKKREEIAQAMERKNPGMDMGKKMAIATAQAKKVAESYGPKRYGSREDDYGHEKPETHEKDYNYGGEAHGISVHDHTGKRIDTISDHASKETAMKMARDRLRQHQLNNTGKRGEIRQHGKVIHSVNEAQLPIQKQPKAGVEKLVSKMNPDAKAKSFGESKNIIREVIKKAVDKQGTNKANGKTATGEPAAKIKIDPVINIGTNRGIGGT